MALNYPPWLLPLALAFWGWRSDTPLAALPLLLLVALARFSPWRWHLERRQYHRIGDLTAVLFLGAMGYFVIGGSGDVPPVYALLRWLPALFCPLVLAQVYGPGNHIPLSALFYSIRRNGKRHPPPAIDFRLPYAFVCALAAGSGGIDDGAYFYGVALLALLTVWQNQPRRQAAPVWLLLFAVAVGLGYAGQIGLTRLQSLVEQWGLDWLASRSDSADPFRARTSIGDVGRLKLSSRVVMRIGADLPLAEPLLLKEVAYDRYLGQSWAAGKAGFSPYIPPGLDGPRHLDVLRIEPKRNVLVSVPDGLRGLLLPPRAGTLTANRLGAIKWLDAPPVLRYRIAYDPAQRDATAPTPEDLEVPPVVAEMLGPLARELGLAGLPPRRAVAAVAGYFERNFAYSLNLGENRDSAPALRDFLYQRRSGHCEYFATATALLLRVAGVPTRFAGGYSVDEYSPEERVYLVRSRHAHAWAEAYVDGAWEAADNTPSVWAEEEAQADPWWRAAADIGSRWLAAFRVWQWERAQGQGQEGFPLWGWLVLPLSLWLGWRLYRSRQTSPSRRPEVSAVVPAAPVDAAYGQLEQALIQAGHPPRQPSEPPLLWLRRIGRMELEGEVVAYYRRRYGKHVKVCREPTDSL
ncbi:transglutaminase-like domain-containing protein [Methylomagnum sp.]